MPSIEPFPFSSYYIIIFRSHCYFILFYSDRVEVLEGAQFGGESSGPIFLDQLHCTGDEESLSECDMYTEPGIHMCGHQNDVGVICYCKLMHIVMQE